MEFARQDGRAAWGQWLAALALATGLTMGGAFSAPAQASTSGVVISQVYGGGGNSGATLTHDFIEVYNAGSAAVNVAGWSVQYASSAGASWQVTNLPALTLQPGQYLLVQEGQGAGGTLALPTPDAAGSILMSGSTGKVALVRSTTALTVATPAVGTYEDLVGFGSTPSAFEGAGPAPTLTNTTATLRALGGCTDTDNNGADFSAGAPTPRNTASPLGTCTPVAAPIVPSCPATFSVASATAATLALSANDVDSIVNSIAFQSGNVAGMSLSSVTPATADGGTLSATLSLTNAIANGTYPIVLAFANNEGQSATCSVTVTIGPVAGFTPIYNIQGSGSTAALLGVQTTRGVVTKVNNNGYYLQDPVGDANPLTSDGIFVFTSTAPTVTAGQLVQITGTVSEFNTGAASNTVTASHTVTEFSNVTNTTVLGAGTVAPTVISFPVSSVDGLERYEGMLVQIDVPLTASQNFFQGRYGQVTLSANGRLIKPTNIYRPGSANALALADLNARSSLMLDDGTSAQNPNPTPYIGADNTLRAGDTLPTGITGVIDYGLATSDTGGIAMYRIHPTVAPVFTRSNPRTATPPVVGGNVKVASFNVLNFFTTFTNGATAAGGSGAGCAPSNTTADCRGADNVTEFNRQRDKIVQAMVALNADVLGLMEIQNNGNTAAQNLVDALNAAVGAGTYAVVPLPPTTGTDAIRVAMIYKPAVLTLSGASISDANAIHNRPPFAQTFAVAANGEKFSVVVNHFKSKGSCPASAADVDADQGDGQGCWNDRRKQQSTALLSFINTITTSAADDDVIVIGDLNAYGVEDPIDVLTSGGLVNQASRFDPNTAYSYVFDGEAGYLDHALASASLSAQILGATHWHINADEPSIIDYNTEFKQPACATCGPDYYGATAYRASDHDPVVIGLNLVPHSTQAITFAQPADRAVNSGAFTPAVSASSGLAVSLTSNTPLVCGANAGTVTLVTQGVCTLAADQPGNASFLPAPTVTRSFNVTAALLAQTISFTQPSDRALSAGAFTLSASASSGLVVAFSASTPAVCTVTTGGNVTLVSVGACAIDANQAGNASYFAAPTVSRTFNVTASGTTPQSINFTALANRALNSGAFALTATATSNLVLNYSSLTPAVCGVSGNSVTLLATGTCTIAANQPGDSIFAAAAQVVQSFSVSAATATTAQVPTLPEWAALLLGALLLGSVLRQRRGSL